MRTLRALVVDDDPDTAGLIEQTLRFEFENFGSDVDWMICTRAAEARSAVRRSDVFDFAVVDLYLDEDQDGLAIVKELKRRDDRTFILVVTAKPERNQNFRDDAEEVGATHAIYRRLLFQTTGKWSTAAVAKRILEHLSSVGLLSLGSVSYDEQDPGIRSVLEAVGAGATDGNALANGERVLRNLATRCLEGSFAVGANLRLSYLAPGRSGAHVCRVDVSAAGQPTESFVIKFGLDRGALERERRANVEACRVLRQQALVSTVGDVQTDASGYSAIAARVADAAVPLADWLVGSSSPAQAREVASVLFREQLTGLTRPELRQLRPVLDWTRPSALYQVRARAALAKYQDVVRHPQAGNRPGAGRLWPLLEAFVRKGWVPTGDPKKLSGSVAYVKGFGDLHASNVLVQVGVHPRPVLVDASLYDSYHWAADSARLLVDVFLRVRRTGVAAMLWSEFGESLRASMRLCPHQVGPDGDEADAPDAFLGQVCRELPEFVQFDALQLAADEWHWQWHVALAKEFLRHVPSPDLTPTRAAVALLAAGYHLRIGGRLLDAAGH